MRGKEREGALNPGRIACDWLEMEDIMNGVIAEFEMELRTKAIEDELERARLVKLARAARSQDDRLAAYRRAATGLSDTAVWLWCQLQSRLSPGMDAAAC
jgi:hypothetical protein